VFNKKSLILLPFLVLVLLFYGCTQKQDEAKKKIKVVAVMSLTSEAKSFGQSSKNALELLSKEFNKKDIDLIYLNDENNKEKVEISLKELVAKEKIKAIILCTQNNIAEVVVKIAADNEIVVINAAATGTNLSKIGKDFIYSICYSNEFEGNALAQFTYEKLKLSKAAILYNEEDAYSKDLADYYKANFEKLGGKVTIVSSYKNDTVDYSEAIKKIKDAKFDILFIPDYFYKVSKIEKQLKPAQSKTVLMGGDGFDSGEVINSNEFEGSYFSTEFTAKDSVPGTIEFKKQYEEKFNAFPDARAALAYDAGKVVMSIFDDSSKADNSEKIKEALGKISIEGVTGDISFNQDKRSKKISYIVQIKNNTIEIINKVLP